MSSSGRDEKGEKAEKGEKEKGGRGHSSLVSIGYGNLITASRVVAIVSPGSSPMRRLREEASKKGKLIDATEGRRTRSIVVTDSDHIVLSAINPDTIAARIAPGGDGDEA